MRILITGVCGFVGFRIATYWKQQESGLEIIGMDNLIRPGSELNRTRLRSLGVEFVHGDIRNSGDFENLPEVDWVLDCAANPSVMAGVDGKSSSRQLMDHNLSGTIEILEYCRRVKAGLLLLSTSRVYGVDPLSTLPMKASGQRFELSETDILTPGVSALGISETFSTEPPLSLYGSSKRAAELLALEYSNAYGFPVWINRCGVMAGPGQFGKADQGIVSFWIHSHRARKPLRYIGFGGDGFQVRDFFDPKDLVTLLRQQTAHPSAPVPRVMNVGGGIDISLSLAELTAWCDDRFGRHEIQKTEEVRPFDIPWIVMDSSLCESSWNWKPETKLDQLLESIAQHAEQFPDWLDIVNG